MVGNRTNRPVWFRCAVGVFAAIAAAAIRLQFLGILEHRAVFVTLFPAVMIAALWGGFGGGLAATIVSAVFAGYFWIEPVGQFRLAHFADRISMVVFLASGLLISYLAEAARRAQARALKAEGQLTLAAERDKAAADLRQSEGKYRELVQNANSAIIRWRRDGAIAFFNEYARKFFGYSEEEIIGKSVSILFPGQDSSGWDPAEIIQGIATHPEKYVNTTNENILRDGSRVWMAWTNRPMLDRDGQVTEILAVGSDMTERKRTEMELRENRAGLDLALRSARMGTWFWDIIEDRRWFDDQVCHLLGIDPSRFTGTVEEFFNALHPGDRAVVRAALARAVDGDGVYQAEYRVIHPDGGVHHIAGRGKVVRDDNGRPVRINGIIWDVTERKRMEEELLRSRDELELRVMERTADLVWTNKALEKQATLLDLAHDAILVVDSGGVVGFWNKGAEDLYGFTRGEAIGNFAHELLRTKYPESREQIMKQVVDEGRWAGELRHATSGGEEVVVESRWALQPLEDGKLPEFLVVDRDITSRKIVEERLRMSDRAFRTLSACNHAVIRQGEETQLLDDICRVLVEVGGYRMAWVGFAQRDEEKTVRPVAHAGHDDGYLDKLCLTWADGERGRGPAGTAIRTGQTCIARNFDENSSFEPWRLDAQRRGYASAIAIPLVIEGRIMGILVIYAPEPDAFDDQEALFLNSLAENLAYGITAIRGALERKKTENALRLANNYNRSLIEASLDPLVTIGPDGRITDANASTEQITGYSREHLIGTDFSGYFTEPEKAREGYEKVFLEGFVRDYALDLKHCDGSVTSVLYNASVYGDGAGRIMGVLAAARDITKRKQAEEALKKSIQEKDLLLKEIHHRVKNNLQVILGLIQMQSRSSSDVGIIQAFVELQGRVRVMALVHDQLYRSHNFSEIDFGCYLNELTSNLLQVFGAEGIVLEVNVGSVVLEIETVVTCGLITTEIVTNALKYAFPTHPGLEGAGELPRRIFVEFTEGESGYTLLVGDNGVGVPDGFDVSAATTMGLHLVHLWSTYQLNGSIETGTAGGTTFIIRFPKRERKSSPGR